MTNELPFPVAVFPVALFNEKYASLHLSYLLLCSARVSACKVENLFVNPPLLEQRRSPAFACSAAVGQPRGAAEKAPNAG